LEIEIGEPLFDRSSKDGTLTPAGRVLFDLAQEMMNMRQHAHVKIRELKDVHRGKLTLSANEYTVMYLLPILPVFRARHPHIKIEVKRSLASRIPSEILGRDAEIGVVSFKPNDKAIAVIPGRPDSVHLADLPRPSVTDVPNGRGVLVKVLRVGVDGTDKEINAAEYGAAPPGFDFLVIGHESFGRVEAVGPNVTELRTGDFVVATVRRPGASIYDRIGTYDMTTDVITIGRGGSSQHVDIKIESSVDVSREYARIRRDAGTGQFFLTDVSTLGTTLNNRHVPRGYDDVDGVRRETGVETPLPDGARIGLAETVFLEFRLA
jgi:hypothetical protein